MDAQNVPQESNKLATSNAPTEAKSDESLAIEVIPANKKQATMGEGESRKGKGIA